jgi:hypothetical protein
MQECLYAEMHAGVQARVPESWDSRVAEAKEILLDPWPTQIIKTTGFLFEAV